MNRAQEIRQRRLNERSTDGWEKWRINDGKAKIKREWVLDMFEKPTQYNSADEVVLCKTDFGTIRIGCKWDQGVTEEIFEDEVMKRLAEIFKEEEGFTGEYSTENCPAGSSAFVTIKIE